MLAQTIPVFPIVRVGLLINLSAVLALVVTVLYWVISVVLGKQVPGV